MGEPPPPLTPHFMYTLGGIASVGGCTCICLCLMSAAVSAMQYNGVNGGMVLGYLCSCFLCIAAVLALTHFRSEWHIRNCFVPVVACIALWQCLSIMIMFGSIEGDVDSICSGGRYTCYSIKPCDVANQCDETWCDQYSYKCFGESGGVNNATYNCGSLYSITRKGGREGEVNKHLDDAPKGGKDGKWRGFLTKHACGEHKWFAPGKQETISGTVGLWAFFGCVCVMCACSASIGGICSAQGNTHVTLVEADPTVVGPGSTMPHTSGQPLPNNMAQGHVAQGIPVEASSLPPAPGGLPEGWAAATDPSTGNTYYYHAATNATSWEMPIAGDTAIPGMVPPAKT